jgi:hypothetical protein
MRISLMDRIRLLRISCIGRDRMHFLRINLVNRIRLLRVSPTGRDRIHRLGVNLVNRMGVHLRLRRRRL